MFNQPDETSKRIAGFSALIFIVVVTAGAFANLAIHTSGQFGLGAILSDAYLGKIVQFTLWQAALSTGISVGLAVTVARALARQTKFVGRNVLLKLFALPLALPALVGVLAILSLWGRAGWINSITGDLVDFSIFGLPGILIAHIFFNLPLATRLLLARLERAPAENWRLASQLAMSETSIFKHIEWPILKTALPGVLALVFMLCLTSFTIVLVLGGGPASTTLEVAIYQSLRFDFDPARAVTLALVQLAITLGLLAISFKFTKTLPDIAGLKPAGDRIETSGRLVRFINGAIILLAGCFVSLPLLALIIDGLSADLMKLLSTPAVWRAIATSFGLALFAGTLSLALCWTLLTATNDPNSLFAKITSFATSAILVMPAIVLGSGWFIFLHKFGDVFSFAPVLVIIINSFMALPFVHRILAPALNESTQKHRRLIASLGLKGWSRWRLVEFQVLKKPLLLAFAFAMALSLGDLGVIALFGSENIITLPLLLFNSLGSYRTTDAQGLALILAVSCLFVLYAADKFDQQGT